MYIKFDYFAICLKTQLFFPLKSVFFQYAFEMNSINWNIDFLRKLNFKYSHKVGFFLTFTRKIPIVSLTVVELQKLPKLQILDEKS